MFIMLLESGMLIKINNRIELCIRACHRNEARALMGAILLNASYAWIDEPVMLVLRVDEYNEGYYFSYESMNIIPDMEILSR